MPAELKWVKQRLTPETRSWLDRAVYELNQGSGVGYRPIKHPFGKVIACHVDGLWLFHLGRGVRPAQLLTLAFVTDPLQWFLPTERAGDFDECCDLLGLRTEDERSHFSCFLRPTEGRVITSPAHGAV